MPIPDAQFLDRRSPPTLATLIFATSVSTLVMNAFVTSLPTVAEDLGASYAFIQLAVSGYLAVTAAVQLLVGPLSDRYGRRPVMLGALAVFALASLGCVLAEDGVTFMIFRMFQAAVATCLVLSRAAVRDLLPPTEAAATIGYMTAAMALVPMVGPMFGGAMEEAFGWRSTFWCFVVFGALALFFCWIDFGETNRSRSESLTEQFRAYPALLRSRRFWGYAATSAFASGSFFALLGGGPYVAREIFGQSPASTGLYLGMIAVGYMTGNLITGRTVGKVSINRIMLYGCLVATIGMAAGLLVNLYVVQSPLAVFGFCAFVGLGNGLSMPTSTTGILSVRPGLAGSASGLGSALMIGGGAALSAFAGAILSPESGAAPLLALMFVSAAISVVAALYVIARARKVAAQPPS